MEQLTGTDSFFLYTERGNVYNHVAALGIYDPSTAPGGKVRFRDILRYFGNRLGTNKVFRRRLVTVPHQFDRPYWVDDADPDLEFHIRHIALPHPGDWWQLMIQVARLHSRPLDRSRPLWQFTTIDGIHNGQVALYSKVHHAAVDGGAGMIITNTMYDITPEPRQVKPPEAAPPAAGGAANPIADLVSSMVRFQLDMWRAAPEVMGNVARMFFPKVPRGAA